MPLRKCITSATAVAWMAAAAPAFAADLSALPWLTPAPEGAAPSASFGDEFSPFGLRSAPPNSLSWRGFYVGGQVGYSDVYGDFSKSTQDPISYSLRDTALESEFAPSDWPVLGTANHGATGFGGFVGYNAEYFGENAKIVLGVEANYDQASLSLVAPNSPISRLTTDSTGNTYLVTITGSGAVTDLDYGTLRARAGLDLGNFLPYGFAGVAIGRANINISETITLEENPPSVPVALTGTGGKDGEWLYGLTVGAGLDVALTRNVFLRGEYEYVEFQPVAGTTLAINTVRAGGGIKF